MHFLRPQILLLVLLLLPALAAAQDPAKWSLESGKRGQQLKAGEQFTANLNAAVEEGWHLYALEQPEGGPIATTIKVSEGKPFSIDGKITAPAPIEQHDPNFNIATRYYQLKGDFNVPLKAETATAADGLSLDVRFQLCNDTFCLPPKTMRVSFQGSEQVGRRGFGSAQTQAAPQQNTRITTSQQPTDIWAFIWLAITFGAISLLTPCVFPMIPITVSYFMKHSDGHHTKTIKLAAVYSIGIIATFSILGMLLAIFLGAAGITLFAANPWVNLLIATIFILFAFNLFGFYEISIPSSVLTKLDNITRTKEGKGSAYIGALLMGLTFTLTSFTCTSPFVGTILVSTSQGDWKMPLLGMLAFSTVFALPFFILATVPRLLHSVPRSGGWLNSVKVVMGFLEIAAAIKFLSNIDLVLGAGLSESGVLNYGRIFTRELVLIIWIIIGLGICAYVLGLFKFKYDAPFKKLSVLRIVFAAFFFGICVHLTTGVLGRKLGELESFLPPKNAESRFNVLGNKDEELPWITNNLEAALQKARTENKKVFVDFTGYTCTNCRWMEANMFPLPAVRHELDKFVLVSLYTDGEGEIYERQQQVEQDMFGTVALPYYAVLDADGRPLATFPGLTRSETEFVDFLRKAQQN